MNRLCDPDGVYRVIGLGSVQSMARQLSRAAPSLSPQGRLVEFKAALIKGLCRYYRAVSTDLEYGFQACREIRGSIGALVLSVQERKLGGETPPAADWRAQVIPGWLAAGSNTWQADAFKVTVNYRGDLPGRAKAWQRAVVRRCAEKCGELGVPFVVEVMSRPLGGREASAPRLYAQRLAEIVAGNVDEFGHADYAASVLKVDFPADLRYCAGIGLPGSRAEDSLYDEEGVRKICEEVTRRAPVPWIILSGGVGLEEFLQRVRISVAGGASGFIGGRSLWAGAAARAGDPVALESWLAGEAGEIHARAVEASRRTT